MRWDEVRRDFPDRWLVVEALEAHGANEHRVFDRLAVIDSCSDGGAAVQRYRDLRRAHPDREFCFVHTANESLDIEERPWFGVRSRHEADAAR